MVRASKFGKNFIDRKKDILEKKKMKVGIKESLEDKDFEDVEVFGVAPVITDSGDNIMLIVRL